MKLTNIEENMLVVGKPGDYYEGLAGTITEVRRDRANFETENESAYEIMTDFSETNDMSKTHSDLNGTGVTDLIMGEDELVYFPKGHLDKGFDIDGNEFQFDQLINKHPNYMDKITEENIISEVIGNK